MSSSKTKLQDEKENLILKGPLRRAVSLLSSTERGSSILKVIYPSRSPLEDLHHHFPFLPQEEFPINVFTCALSKDILLQGKMFVSQNWICFYSNIFGYETKVKIELKNVLLISREKTVFFVPNAISITTANKRHLFCSFLSRETVYKLLLRLWQAVMIDLKADQKDGPPMALPEEEVTLEDLPVDDFHSQSLNVFGTPSLTIGHNVRRSLSYDDLESSSLKKTRASASTRRGINRAKADRATYPFVYNVSFPDFDRDAHQLAIQEWATLHDTKSTDIGDITDDILIPPGEEEFIEKEEKTLSKGRHIFIKIIMGLFHFIFNLTWIVAIIIIFPFKRFSRQSLIICASFVLFCVLTSMTVVMLTRVNNLSRLLEAASAGQLSESLCNGHDAVGQYDRYLEHKRLERARSILKTNLITVSEIHEALVKLNENLKK